ncbi:hypothetical protein LCGC14_1831630 [marine sediment metagenome]|uniref:Uncharacterized protein n=1 Tax=marine sediment metagenome TaxID=412755 RepID=A0A0F9JFF2_9ZZZZ
MRSSRPPINEDLFRTAAITPLRESDYFVLIGSESYVKSLEDPSDSEHIMILSQVLAAKDANKPVIVLWIKDISELSKEKLRNILKGMNVIGEHESTLENQVQEDVDAIKKIMDEHPV